MKSIQLNIPHVQQPKNSVMCGAACLEMVYLSFGYRIPQRKIWGKINAMGSITKRLICRTYLMGKHARSQGLIAHVVAASQPLDLLSACFENQIRVITLCRPDLSSNCAHFCVVTGFDETHVYLNDPERDSMSGKNLSLEKTVYLRSLMAGGEISRQNTFLLIAENSVPTIALDMNHICSQTTICQKSEKVFESICSLNLDYLCLEHDRWLNLSTIS